MTTHYFFRSCLSQILGLNTVPVAGDEFEIVDTVDGARSKAAAHAEVMRSSRLVALAGEGKVTLHSFANAVAASQESGVERHQLNLVLKVDAQVIWTRLTIIGKFISMDVAATGAGGNIAVKFL